MVSFDGFVVDVLVVGGGHAAIEAAHAAAKLGCKVAMVLPNPDKIGLMPCNPAIGGPGKSQLVFELHALGGVMGRLADATAIHARTLNASKGPAVQSLRVQNERDGYATAARQRIESTAGITVVRGEVASIETTSSFGKGWVTGVTTSDGRLLNAKSVVLCTGTFLAGVVWYGKQQREAGRQGEPPARYLSKSLRDTGHKLLRFKTGTPPRIRSDSVNFDNLQRVPSDDPPASFTGMPGPKVTSSPTWLTHTTPKTHELIQANLEQSAMYGGVIEGRGPRYCPSIEDKVVRFSDKERHLLFVEPDGIETSEVYLQGFSSSMPPYLQDDMIRTLPGFENAVIHRYAYAVEYDAIDPTQLDVTMMSKIVPGLFSAGQINGTSGYEEAAVQGFISGVNAAKYVQERELVYIPRNGGYIGVLLDELVRWDINEPYRMLTSRNEHRLLHRQDNALDRLSSIGHAWGLVSDAEFAGVRASQDRVDNEVKRLSTTRFQGDLGSKIICRPNMTYKHVVAMMGESSEMLNAMEQQKVEIVLKYSSYIDRSQREFENRKVYEELSLTKVNFAAVPSLSTEGKQMLEKSKPPTLGAAQRLRSVRDSDITALLIYLKSKNVSRETLGI
ncbi:MAG: tRNA uridine-5-carboxymethylaminomethyl(34) synthesis enzyme MnmG [Trueperaceae bacterium]